MVLGGHIECEEPRCAERPREGLGVPGWTQKAWLSWVPGGVGPWQYQSGYRGGCWVGSTPPPYPPSRTVPGEYPCRRTHRCTTSAGEGATRALHMTVLRTTKEILGVDNAQYQTSVSLDPARPTLRPLLPRPLLGRGAGYGAGSGSHDRSISDWSISDWSISDWSISESSISQSLVYLRV